MQEIHILSALKWKVGDLTAYEFMDQFILRLPLPLTGGEQNLVRNLAGTIIDMCYLGMGRPPSLSPPLAWCLLFVVFRVCTRSFGASHARCGQSVLCLRIPGREGLRHPPLGTQGQSSRARSVFSDGGLCFPLLLCVG